MYDYVLLAKFNGDPVAHVGQMVEVVLPNNPLFTARNWRRHLSGGAGWAPEAGLPG
jgi:hypothetical protein